MNINVEQWPHKRMAKITGTELGYQDHGIFTLMLFVEYGRDSGGGAQGIGGARLDRAPIGTSPVRSPAGPSSVGTAVGMEWIIRVLRACGVEKWERLTGRTIYVLMEDGGWNARAIGIAPLPTERGEPFLFADLKDWQAP